MEIKLAVLHGSFGVFQVHVEPKGWAEFGYCGGSGREIGARPSADGTIDGNSRWLDKKVMQYNVLRRRK